MPPVSEVIFDVQFLPIQGLTTAHFGLLWSRLRDRFPLTEDQPPLEPHLEKLPGRHPGVGLVLEISHLPPPRRVWLLKEDHTEVLQLQGDRFIRNWRRVQEDQTYPGYEKLKAACRQDWQELVSLLQEEKLSLPRLTQGELAYLNRFPAGIGWEHLGQAHRLLRVWRWPDELRGSEPPETVRTTVTFLIRRADGRVVGRLYVDLVPLRDANRDFYLLRLSARGRPEPESLQGAFEFFDLGHRAILQAFQDLCQPELLSHWKIDLVVEEGR
ncbi:MAG TPA: TIGR04255 family protein [Candidatus Nitrosotenuis sp.]|jgi:uncharacterized protein (TIGR04255 family)|nr:TIGR04255 family protein [Candidatus Nitrosotenuis sp.]